MTNDDDAFEEFPSLCPPVVAAAATRCRHHRPPHVDQGFLSVSPKWYRLQIPVTLLWLWLLETIDNEEGRGDGGEKGGGDLCRPHQAGGAGWRAKGGGGGRPTQQVSALSLAS